MTTEVKIIFDILFSEEVVVDMVVVVVVTVGEAMVVVARDLSLMNLPILLLLVTCPPTWSREMLT